MISAGALVLKWKAVSDAVGHDEVTVGGGHRPPLQYMIEDQGSRAAAAAAKSMDAARLVIVLDCVLGTSFFFC